MNKLFTAACCFLFVSTAIGQSGEPRSAKPDSIQKMQIDSTKKLQIVEAACGECQLGLKGKGCNLAIRIDGKVYLVDGTSIDAHGDAHAEDGFCNAVRKAEVQGEIVDNRFKATYLRLIKPKKM